MKKDRTKVAGIYKREIRAKPFVPTPSEIERAVNRWEMGSHILQPEFKELIQKYGLSKKVDDKISTSMMLWAFGTLAGISLQWGLRAGNHMIKNERRTYEDLVFNENIIEQIKIYRRGRKEPYTFKKDIFILRHFDNLISKYPLGPAKEMERSIVSFMAGVSRRPKRTMTKDQFRKQMSEFENHFSHVEVMRLLEGVVGKFFKTENEKYRFIWEVYKVIGYPFTTQQKQADDSTKSKLIRNWFKRNKRSFK